MGASLLTEKGLCVAKASSQACSHSQPSGVMARSVTTRRVSRLLLNVDDIALFAFLLAHWYVISLSPVDPPPLTSPTDFRWPIFAACTYSMQQAEEDPRRRRREKAAKNEMGPTLL